MAAQPPDYFASVIFSKEGTNKKMMYLKNVGKRALALVLALMMCVGMLGTTAFAADGRYCPFCVKNSLAYVAEVPGTCSAEGVKAHYECTLCGRNFHRNSGIPNVYVGPVDRLSKDPNNHANTETVTVAATCVNVGSETVTCKDCGKKVSETTLQIDPANHVHTETVTVAATCLNQGSVTVTCADCGDEISSTTLGVDSSNHDAACTVKNDREFDADGHWTVRTCGATGTKEPHLYLPGETVCNVCGYKKTTEPPVDPTEPVDPTDKCEHGKNPAECLACHMALGKHNYQYYNDTEATCTEDAVCKWDNCSFPGCNASYDQVFEGTKLGHSFTNYVPNNDATCMKDGTETATCDREGCGATDTRTVAGSKLEHDFSGKLVPLNLDEHVVYCANSYGCGTHSEPVAHSFDITVGGHPNAVQATCQHMGIEVTQCKCGLEHYEVIEKLDHNYVDGKCTMCGKYADHECSFTVEGAVIREATCAQKGLKWYSCGVCGSSTAVEYEDWKNHAGYHESARVAATCEDDEKVSFVCVGCGDTYDTTIPGTATGHTPNDPVEENRVAPQIGVPGSYDSVVYCDVCGKELSRTPNTIPALFDDQVYIDDTDTPLGGGDEVELDDNAIPLAGPVTRAEFVDYLYRREGSPEAGLSTFEDVPADHEYAYAIGWGQANDIAYGVSATEFLPDELVTVEQAKLFLSRYAKLKGIEMPELAALVGLDDQDYAMNCDEILGEFFGSDE